MVVVARRHSLGFFQKRQKWKILIFRFCRYRGFRGEAPNAVIGFFPMVKCALWESFLRLFRRNEEACIPSLLLKMKTPSNGAYEINTVILGRINVFAVFRFELECYSTLSNVLYFLRGRNHFFGSNFIFRLENPL